MTNSTLGKDASWPIGSSCLVGICCAVFAMISLGRFPTALNYVVRFDGSMQPLQWFTSLFIHAHVLQLIVGAVFLVAIGGLIEARLRFGYTVSLFIFLGALGQAIVQLALLDHKPGGVSLGAAAGISGWAGFLLVWSPAVKVTQIAKIPLGKAGLPIWILVLAWAILGGGVSIAILGPISLLPQTVSALAGAVLAAILLKNKVIEGEYQDVLTLLAGTAPGGRKERQKLLRIDRMQAVAAEQVQQQLAAAQEQLETYMNAHQLAGAIALINKMAGIGEGLQVSKAQLTAIIRGLHKERKWEESIPWLRQYLERYPEDVAMRLKLAHIFVVDQRLPGSGMEVMKPLFDAQLPEADEKLLRQLERAACNMYEDDDIELEVEKRAW